MEFVQNINKLDINEILNSHSYLNAKQLFFTLNGKLPLHFNIHPFDFEKGLNYLTSVRKDELAHVFTSSLMENNKKKAKYVFEYAIVVMNDKSVLHLGDSFCTIYALPENVDAIQTLSTKLKTFKRRERKKEFELNLISFEGNCFS
ncbi:MAG TPA: hypothetical protein PK431_14745, partial [Chitinophagales bacterium]|nr:hypothetical protein [Chitinophagales bacterium]